MEPCDYNCLEPAYEPVFGNGPFQTTPVPGTSALEYAVDQLEDEVSLLRGPWTDAFGNKLLSVKHTAPCLNLCVEDCEECHRLFDLIVWPLADVLPQYTVTEAVTGEVVVEAEGWEETALGPVTEIGRYLYERSIEHGYLGDIKGHESLYEDVCCVEEDPCDCDCEPGVEETCEYPIRVDGDKSWFAISPADVGMSRWSWSWVMAMYEWDLTNGIDAFNYGPAMEITRGQMAAFLARLMGDVYGLEPLGTAMQFSDVAEGYIFADDILFIRDYGITNGYGDGTYGPENSVKRSEMAKFIQLTFKTLEAYLGSDVTWWDTKTNNVQPHGLIFEDVGLGTALVEYIDEMFVDNLTDGCKIEDGDLFFCPDLPVTREQMAKFIMRAVQTDEATQDFWPVLAPEK
jgi:hypothetical protein